MPKFQIIRRIGGDDCVPSNWWGLCWYEDYANVNVIAPIPLNLLVALARRWHQKLAYVWVKKLLRGAQISRRQHVAAQGKVYAIICELSRHGQVTSDATGTELTTYHHPDLPLYQYLADVLDRDLRRTPRNVR